MNSGIHKIPLFFPVHLPEMERAVLDVIRSGQIASGPLVEEFEKKLAHLVHHENMVATNDMTSALVLALKLAGVKAGDYVATQAFSCLSTNSAISMVGAIPQWIDTDPETLSMCPEDLEKKISSKTKAVILYHIAGYPAKSLEISAICRKIGVKLIEDCNNSLGAKVDGDRIGKTGDFAIYSFYPNRQINGFDGGAIACPDAEAAIKARKLRRFGVDAKNFRDRRGEISSESDVPEIGVSASFNQVSAAAALAQFPTLSQRENQVINNAEQLNKGLLGRAGIGHIKMAANVQPAYWVYLIYLENRDEVLAKLKEVGIQASILHHRNDIYTGFGAPKTDLPGTSYIMDHIVAIPCGWWLNEDGIDHIILTINNILN